MIAKLTGTISDIGTRYVVIDVNDVGYKVFVTDDTLHHLKKNKEVSLLTHLAVRENALDLYGFLSKKDKDFFELLITISGIGPKSALNILSLVTAETLATSVRTGSVAHLVKVSGLGKKTAEKIVLELKDKLGDMESVGEFSVGMSSDMDAIEALKALGYDADEAREAMKKVSLARHDSAESPAEQAGKDILDTGAKVKAALKELSK